MINIDISTLSAIHILISFICCYVGGMLTMIRLDVGNTPFIKAVGHLFIGWSIGLVIAIIICALLLPLAGIG